MNNDPKVRTNLVPVTIWRMYSDPGRIFCAGWQYAVIVPAEKVPADARESSEALYRFACDTILEDWSLHIREDDIIDSRPYRPENEGCAYLGMTGLVEVPEGHVLITFSSDETSGEAEIVSGKKCLAHSFRKRAEQYSRLAEQLEG